MDGSTGTPAGPPRARLVAAAWVVLERSGFEGFKVQLVLRETGLSAREFYRHFSGKDQLLLALMEDEMHRSGTIIASLVSAEVQPAAQVEIWIRAIIGAAGDPRRASRARLFSTQEVVMRSFPDEVARAREPLTEPLAAAIRAGIRDRSFPMADMTRDVDIIYSLAGGLLTACLDDPARNDLEKVSAAAVDFALRALGASG